jgi:hypothetical protein
MPSRGEVFPNFTKSPQGRYRRFDDDFHGFYGKIYNFAPASSHGTCGQQDHPGAPQCRSRRGAASIRGSIDSLAYKRPSEPNPSKKCISPPQTFGNCIQFSRHGDAIIARFSLHSIRRKVVSDKDDFAGARDLMGAKDRIPDRFKDIAAAKSLMSDKLRDAIARLPAVTDFAQAPRVPQLDFDVSSLNEAARLRREAIDSQIELADLARMNLASEHCQRLAHQIQEFDKSLTDDCEVGIRLVTFGQTVTIHVESIGYYDPSLIIFYGQMDGQPVSLIQHVSQISFLLTSLKRADPTIPKRPFGFHSQKAREFTDQAEALSMVWDEQEQCWIATDGKRFDRNGFPLPEPAP